MNAFSKLTGGREKVVRCNFSEKWTIIYKMEPDKPNESISFFVTDDNNLFF